LSVSRLNVTALQRDYSAPKSPELKPTSPDDVVKVTNQGAIETLATMIPTEPLAFYTAMTALFLAELSEGEPLDQYLPQRWILFGVLAAAIPAYLFLRYRQNRTVSGQRLRKGPWAEIFGATAAFAAWALVTPGSPLAAVLEGSAERLTLGTISIGAVAFLTLIGLRLTEPAKR
jgi:hypothetical protein